MRKNVKNIIIMMMVAFVAISANAQSVNTDINTRDFQACKEYLATNPTDTIVNVFNIQNKDVRGKVTRRVYLRDNRFTAFNDTIWYKQEAKKVLVDSAKNTITVTSELHAQDGRVVNDTVVWTRTSTNQTPFAIKVAKARGEVRALDSEHIDFDGNPLHKTQATALAGGMVSEGFSPVVTGRLGYETCHFLFELEGSLSRSKYTEVAEVQGRYTSLAVQFNAGWKFVQDRRYRHFLAVLGTVGYGYHRTDHEAAQAVSRNYGFIGGGMVRGSLGLSSHWRLVGETGYRLVTKVRHNEDQDLSNGGFFFNVGIGYTW